MKYVFFWILWSVAVLLGSVPIYFFFVGLLDGTVSSFNIILWVCLLLIIAGVIGGSLWLGRTERPLIAILPLLIILLPGFFFGAYALMFVFGNGRVN